MSEQQLLFVDVDSTLNNHWKRIREFSSNGIINPQEAFKNTITDQPLPLAKEALDEFENAGWKIFILTARPWDMEGEATLDWLNFHGFTFDEIIVVEAAEHKMAVIGADEIRGCRTPKTFRLFVDDFTSGQEFQIPVLTTRIYEAARRTGVPTEPFRNNWADITERHLGIIL